MAELPKAQPSAYARTRRRRSKAFPILGIVFTAIVLAWFFESQATTTILFVRHAETAAPDSAGDPPLAPAGRARAEVLADFLESVDVVAGVDAIYAGADRRTRETAEPLASRLGLRIGTADPYQVEAFMQRVLRDHKGDVVLIVTPADAIAPLIEELHGSKHVEIPPNRYDSLYVVTIPWFGKVKTLHFRYGLGMPSDGAYRGGEMSGGAGSDGAVQPLREALREAASE